MVACEEPFVEYLPHELDHGEAILVLVEALLMDDLALTAGVLHVSALVTDRTVAHDAEAEAWRLLRAAERAGTMQVRVRVHPTLSRSQNRSCRGPGHAASLWRLRKLLIDRSRHPT